MTLLLKLVFCQQRKIMVKTTVQNNYIKIWSTIVFKPYGGKLLFQTNLKFNDVKVLRLKSSFWTEVLETWCEYTFVDDMENINIGKQIIWYNSLIRVGGCFISNKQCINKQLIRLEQLYHEGLLLDRIMLNILFGTELSTMQYNSIISAIPQQWHRTLSNQDTYDIIEYRDKALDLRNISQKLVSKIVYAKMLKPICDSVNLQAKWLPYFDVNDEDGDINIDKANLFLHTNSISIDSRLRSFQYKVLHRILFFNDKLYIFKLVDNDYCDFCNGYQDSFEHRLWKCEKSMQLWNQIIDWFNITYHSNSSLNYYKIISNNTGSTLLDIVVLSTKFYLYKCFLSKSTPNIASLICHIKEIETIECDIATRRNKVKTHMDKWMNLR